MLDCCFFFFQAEDGIRDLVRSRGLGDVYKRQVEMQDLIDGIVQQVAIVADDDHGSRIARQMVLQLSLIHI